MSCDEMKRNGWIWNGEYALMTTHQFLNCSRNYEMVSYGDDQELNSCEINEEVEDLNIQVSNITKSVVEGINELFLIKYHVVFNEVFQCPALYFNIYDSTDQLLQPQQVVDLFQRIGQSRGYIPVNNFNPYNFITQGEHPILQTIFYYIHPCETHSLMETICMNTTPRNYIYSWLSFFGKAINLHVPIIEKYC